MTNLQFFEELPISGSKANQLVLLLHGYGSNGQNLITLAHEFARVLPDAHFISPNAPFKLDNNLYEGYQWFSLSNYDPQIIFPQIIKANDIIDQFIKQQLERLSLQYNNLIVIGFSQGSMMAMYNSLRAKEKVAGIVSYSGRLILPTTLNDKINSKPPICLIHGTKDIVVPFDNMTFAVKILEELQIPFEAYAIEGLEHQIDSKGIRLAKKFLEKILKYAAI